MKNYAFYEKTEVTHEVVESRRSETCYDLITALVAKRLNHGAKKRVLDIGCGDGSFITKFKNCCTVFGVDISSKAVELAEKAGLNAYRLDISSEKLPFENEYFDLVYMGDVIEHLVNPDFAIDEAARVMRPNGYLVITTPNLASWLNRMLLLLGFQPLSSEVSTVKDFGRPDRQSRISRLPVGHLRIFTFRALKEFLSYYRFEIIEAKGVSFGMQSKTLSIIDGVLSRITSFASIIIVIARKN